MREGSGEEEKEESGSGERVKERPLSMEVLMDGVMVVSVELLMLPFTTALPCVVEEAVVVEGCVW